MFFDAFLIMISSSHSSQRNHRCGFSARLIAGLFFYPFLLLTAAISVLATVGCRTDTPVSASMVADSVSHELLKSWQAIDGFEKNLAVFETVFWDPRDTESLRRVIRERPEFQGACVMEIGTGSGLLSFCCLKAGADRVVATDINPNAVENARFNATLLGLEDQMEVRLVSTDASTAFSVIGENESFDIIVSNPPWVSRKPQTIDEYALYDENFALMNSLFEGLEQHLNSGGTLYLAYGCVDAIRKLQGLAKKHSYQLTILDDRKLDDLPEEFLPGMLIEIKIPKE